MCTGGCGGGGYVPPRTAIRPQIQQPVFNPNCSYTLDQLFQWKYQMECVVRSNNAAAIGSTISDLNSQIGIVQSAINYFSTSPCWFQQRLDQIANTIRLILNNTSC
jgi:hypothetical protein